MKSLLSFALCATLCFGAPGALAQAGVCDESTGLDAVADTGTRPASPRADQVIYKGVVGNLLEAVPLDPEQRVELQRTNAVVSNPLSARSFALLLGIANPVVMLGGLLWGIWAASQIESAPEAKRVAAASNDAIPAALAAE
jgi:hypothetical protein